VPALPHELPTDDAEYETWRARQAADDDDRYGHHRSSG
jgi:hypothetical protein